MRKEREKKVKIRMMFEKLDKQKDEIKTRPSEFKRHALLFYEEA